jgi:hypothetical protein
MMSNKNQPINPKISSVSKSNLEKINDFHKKITPNAILNIFAILEKGQKQNNISAFVD